MREKKLVVQIQLHMLKYDHVVPVVHYLTMENTMLVFTDKKTTMRV